MGKKPRENREKNEVKMVKNGEKMEKKIAKN